MLTFGNILGLIMLVLAGLVLFGGVGLTSLKAKRMWPWLLVYNLIIAAYLYFKYADEVTQWLKGLPLWIWIPAGLILVFLFYVGLGKTLDDVLSRIVNILLVACMALSICSLYILTNCR